MPDLEAALWQPFRDRGVLVIGIHSGEPAGDLADFVEQTGITFPVVGDRGTRQRLAFPPGVGYPYPRDVVIGKDLTVHAIRNSFNVQEMQSLVERLLAEP